VFLAFLLIRFIAADTIASGDRQVPGVGNSIRAMKSKPYVNWVKIVGGRERSIGRTKTAGIQSGDEEGGRKGRVRRGLTGEKTRG